MSSNFEAQYERSQGAVAFIANRHIIDHMRRLCVELAMDFELVYVWGLVAHLSATRFFSPGGEWLADPGVGPVSAQSLQGVRLADLTAISGLPRETLRRKLEALQKLGKLSRDSKGLWVLQPGGVDEKTQAFIKQTVQRLLKAARDIEQVLARP